MINYVETDGDAVASEFEALRTEARSAMVEIRVARDQALSEVIRGTILPESFEDQKVGVKASVRVDQSPFKDPLNFCVVARVRLQLVGQRTDGLSIRV